MREIGWTNHLIILSRTKTEEEREFYLKLTLKEKYSKRELDRQISSGLFEQTNNARQCMSKTPPGLKKSHNNIADTLKDDCAKRK